MILIHCLQLCGDTDNFGQFLMNTLELDRFVRLDAAALNALNITGNTAAPQSSPHTIINLLDRCRTSHGHR